MSDFDGSRQGLAATPHCCGAVWSCVCCTLRCSTRTRALLSVHGWMPGVESCGSVLFMHARVAGLCCLFSSDRLCRTPALVFCRQVLWFVGVVWCAGV